MATSPGEESRRRIDADECGARERPARRGQEIAGATTDVEERSRRPWKREVEERRREEDAPAPHIGIIAVRIVIDPRPRRSLAGPH